MQTIRTPDGQVFKFPDTMTRAEIAEALKRRLGNQTVQQQSNPAGTGITRAIKRGAVQTAAAPFTIAATADVRALGDIGKSEDAIRYDEAIRAGVPTQAFASRSANISDPKQVNAMMQQYGVSPAANVNYQQVVDKRLERRADAAQNPEEYLKRLSENSATAGRLFKLADSFARSPTADAYAKSLAEAPDGFKGWLSTVTDDPLGFMAFMGETIAESAPQIGAGLATSVVTGSPAAGATVMSLGGFSREYANEVNNFLRENGIDLADPESAKKLFSSPELMDKANERGVTRGLVIAAADFAGQGLVAQQVIRKSLKRQAVAQGGSEGAGEALATKAVGDVFSFKETITEALAGTGSTIGEAAVAKTLFNKDGKLASADDLSTLPISEKLAAADVARMLDEISKANGYKLKNVDPSSNKGAKQTLEDARSTNVQAINDLKDVLKKKLDKKNAQSLEELLSVYTEAAAGIGAGKKKVSQKVTVSQLQALEGLVGDTKEGQQLLQELLKSNVITDLFKDGMKGGISQFTDLFNPISHNGAVYDPKRYFNVLVSGFSGMTLGVPTTAAIYSSGRIVDFFTGRRSKVAKFVNSNKKALGLPAPEGTSLIEQKAKQKADAKDRRAAIAQIATILDAPKAGFVENILLGTGLDRSGLETVLNDMASDFGSNPDFVAILDDIRKNLDGEGVAYLDNLSEIIPVIGAYAQVYSPELVTNTPDNPLLKRSFDSPNVQTDMPTMGGGGSQFGEQLTTPENYRRGIQDNLDFVRALQDGAGKDKKLSKVDRGRLITSLENLTNNLGSNPVETVQTEVQKLQDQGVNQDAIDTYVKPYVDRVVRQQRPKTVQAAADAGVAPNLDALQAKLREARGNLEESTPDPETGLTPEEQAEIRADAEALGKRLTEIFNKNKKPRLSMEPIEDQPNVPEIQQSPILNSEQNPLNIDQNDLQATNVDIMPTSEEIEVMRNEPKKYKPEQKRTLVEAVDYLNKRWQKATGRTEPFEYTPENVDRISSLMATEAMQALKNDGNAIGWYDRKLKAAKAVVSLVDPRVTQSPDAEAAFDFALAVTSNGQAVADNFEYALEVFRHFMDNGVMPTDTWIKGGERNQAMVDAFDFFNTYNASGLNMPIQDFLDADYTVKELEDYISRFNTQYGTNIGVPSSEGKGVTVKGSYIIGPKIGQGFYQNIRGNYDPLTMDIWWMRMWNRLTGRPFEDAKDIAQNRNRIRELTKTKNQNDLERRLTRETLKELGLTRSDLKNDETLDTFVTALEKRYQSFFRKRSKELKGTGKKVEKPELFKASGTMVKNMVPQLQAQPKNTSERQYMREATQAAIEKLRQNGYMITTADFQALMWYPEKQLFRKLGVAAGRGADNDYLDAAIMLAEKEGFTNDQINQALPSSDGDGAINSQSGAEGSPSGVSPRFSQLSQEPTGSAGILFRNASQSAASRRPSGRDTVPTTEEVKQAAKPVKALLEIGSPDGEFPDGIKDLDGVRRLAEATNIVIKIHKTQEDLVKSVGKAAEGRNISGAYFEGVADVLQTGATTQTKRMAKFDTYITALHEVMHGLSDQFYNPDILANMDSEARAKMEGRIAIGRDYGTNKVTGRKEIASTGSFDAFIAGLTTGKTKMPNDVRKKILAEMLDLQKNGYFRSQDGRVMDVRNRRAMETNTDFKKYVRSAPETAVDALVYYGHDPKRMKREYPNLAKMIKGFFSESSKVQFFTHPLAMAMAVVYAILMKQEQAEEEELQRGILAQQQAMQAGALTI